MNVLVLDDVISHSVLLEAINQIKNMPFEFSPNQVLMHPRDYRRFDIQHRKDHKLGRLPRKLKLKRYGRLK